jgi:hypothetical protein
MGGSTEGDAVADGSVVHRTLLWQGMDDDPPRMEIAHVTLVDRQLRAEGTQISVGYELRYAVTPERLDLEVVGVAERSVELVDADFFDVGFSPLFNSLPVRRDDLLNTARARDYLMLWVSVPDLTVERSEQSYQPLGDHRIRFVAGDFTSTLTFDDEGWVVDYPGLARRIQ